MKVQIKNLENKAVGELELPDTIFDYPFKEHLIHLAVEAWRAAQRQGTHKVKTRGEVRGSGRKPWRQKGTGRARVGSVRTPLWRSGGIVHGPQPRSHEKGLSPREKRNALKSALSRKLADEQIVVLDSFELATHKTQDLMRHLVELGVADKVLLVDSQDNENLMLASRNNPAVKAVDALALNVYDVVGRAHIVISQAALQRMTEVLAK
jgi:large subunit ribosomal protein L4